jgi:hypothetical protein
MVLESVHCTRGEEAGEADGGVEAMLATYTGTDGEVVVKGFTDVKEFDAWMEENGFVKRTIDIELRCMNPGSPAEPVSGEDTERVWVKRGSAELAALDKLIANERARKWQWQCPESPRSPVYRPARPVRPVRPVRPAYAYGPEPVDNDDDEMD